MSRIIKPGSAPFSALPRRKPALRRRELVTVQQGSDYQCDRCGWHFAEDANPPKVASLLEIMRFYELQAEKQFAAHRCS